MNQFTLESKHKSVLIGALILGILCLGLTFLGDDEFHSRFWSNYLHNTVFFTGIAFVSLFILAAFTTAYAGWHTVFKRIWEAYAFFLIPGLILFLVIIAGIWGHFHHLYHWTNEADVNTDPILAGKSSFLNKYWYTFGTIIIVGIWIYFAQKIRSISLEEDLKGTADYAFHRRLRRWSAAFLPIAGFTSAALIWQWVMSVDAHWYSTLFAWYATASWFVSTIALTIMTLIFLKSRGYYENVTNEHLHDLGKYMFAFSVFWTYLWFSQYMLIWYANNGEETIYFRTRLDDYRVLFFGNLLLNFATPFLVLLRNDTKRKYGTLVFASIICLFGHWWDFFLMIKPGVLHTAHEAMAAGAEHAAEAAHHGGGFTAGFTIPGLLEVGTMIGFLGGFLWFVLSRLEKAPLTPSNDPYIEESLHHHV
jgi:hypothetical protein